MVFVRADREDLDGHAATVTRAALADCRAHGLPCVIEAMTYRLDDESEAAFAARHGDLVRESAVLLEACGAELLKLEYPGSAAGVRGGHRGDRRAVGGAVGRASGHDEFCAQLAASRRRRRRRASSPGRSLWKECVGLDGAERRAFLDGEVRGRFAELVAVLDAACCVVAAPSR